MSLVISHFTSEKTKLQTDQPFTMDGNSINMDSDKESDYILDSEEDKDYNM